jgi:hypothetical protein
MSQSVGRNPEGQEERQERRKHTKQQIMRENEKEQKKRTANKIISLALTSTNTSRFYRKQRYMNDVVP